MCKGKVNVIANLSFVIGEIPTTISVKSGTSGTKMVSSRAWGDTDDTHDLIESLYNYTAVVYHLRPWSYEGWAAVRAFHSVSLLCYTSRVAYIYISLFR